VVSRVESVETRAFYLPVETGAITSYPEPLPHISS